MFKFLESFQDSAFGLQQLFLFVGKKNKKSMNLVNGYIRGDQTFCDKGRKISSISLVGTTKAGQVKASFWGLFWT